MSADLVIAIDCVAGCGARLHLPVTTTWLRTQPGDTHATIQIQIRWEDARPLVEEHMSDDHPAHLAYLESAGDELSGDEEAVWLETVLRYDEETE